MSNFVFVLNTDKRPLDPIHPASARKLLEAGIAAIQVDELEVLTSKPLWIKATGHGTRQMCGTDKYGFPTRHKSRVQVHKGFQTGDIVKALVTSGKTIGSYVGRVLCRASGSFDIATKAGRVAGISHKCCQSIHQKDGYGYGY